MDQSERLQRAKEHRYLEDKEVDQKFANRILSLLNHHDIDKYCMVDAYYYDFCVIPDSVQARLNLWSDCYLIFGITKNGEMVSKWVDRWDLDSDDPIVDGKVIHSKKPSGSVALPKIEQIFDPKLLSTPAPDFLSMFSGEICAYTINNGETS